MANDQIVFLECWSFQLEGHCEELIFYFADEDSGI